MPLEPHVVAPIADGDDPGRPLRNVGEERWPPRCPRTGRTFKPVVLRMELACRRAELRSGGKSIGDSERDVAQEQLRTAAVAAAIMLMLRVLPSSSVACAAHVASVGVAVLLRRLSLHSAAAEVTAGAIMHLHACVQR